MVSSFTDEKGKPDPASVRPELAAETLTTSTFTEDCGRTTVTVRMVPINATASRSRLSSSGPT